MVNLQRDLRNDERSIFQQQILGFEHAAALRVLDRDEGKVHRLVGHPVKGMPQRAEGLRCGGGKGGVERLFGVGAGFPLVADRELACDPRTLSNETPRATSPYWT